MQALQQILYKASATATGGRDGSAQSDDGRLQARLSVPAGLGGDDGAGTNPEQLFAAGYAACFIGALKHVAAAQKITLGNDIKVSAEVAIGPVEQGFALAVTLLVALPDLATSQAQRLIENAHEVCPYSNATRGNIAVELRLV
ncbi:organic hydroperoxide resistance protein [Salinimonas sediminis]|uniref:Organic hydroperoxide resistance protein n=1 Tax=Salinimonas sediminis TaxID=2303538 RepID=A0A346NJ40_9ALTE|nr:organic hydroperoxide resistance protein [Salinimonas sediminis]AXR05547.1 organic hydroperoxide resistance protein [Salinimonas sediminis]